MSWRQPSNRSEFLTKNLKYLPYTWSLINRRLKNPIFKNFQLLLDKHVKIKRLKKINTL